VKRTDTTQKLTLYDRLRIVAELAAGETLADLVDRVLARRKPERTLAKTA